MCDPKPVILWLLAILALMLTTVALVIYAAVQNASIWHAGQSPLLMLAAGAASYGASVFSGFAVTELNKYCSCIGETCSGSCSNLRNLIIATGVVLGIQGTACLSAALYSWIPGLPQPQMWIIVGALIVQIVLLIAGLATLRSLLSCAANNTNK